jgi:hypothetical protein
LLNEHKALATELANQFEELTKKGGYKLQASLLFKKMSGLKDNIAE